MISLRGRSPLQYRCRFDLQDQPLQKSRSQDPPLEPQLDLKDFQDQLLQGFLSQGLPLEPQLDHSDFWDQSHQSPD